MRVLMLQIIEATAPRHPRCFEGQREWVDWLHMAHESGLRVTRRRDVGKTRNDRQTWQEVLPADQIDYCVDCTSIHRDRMVAAGRCERITKEQAMIYEGLARAAHNIHREHVMATGAQAGPVWDAETTKARNALIARCQAIHDAIRQDRDARDIGEDRVFFATVRWLLPAFQAVEHAKKHVEMVSQASEEEQIGALLYITAMVRRFGGETGTVSMSRQDMEAACDYDLMRHDEDGGGLILKVERKVELAEPPAPQIVMSGPGVVPLDLARPQGE